MNKKGFAIVLVLLGAGVAAGIWQLLQAPTSQDSSEKTQVTASFYPLYFFATRIGGEKAHVINITPAGAEPHDYEPTPQQMAQIEASTLLVLNGGGLEAWGDTVLQNINPERTVIVKAGEELMTREVMEEGERIADPHVWLSPPLAKKMVDVITSGFVRVDSANAAYYKSNGGALKAQLDALDGVYRDGLKSCTQKNIVTAHEAFGYLASAYGFSQVAITGISPDSEPSSQELAELADFVKRNKIQYIFFESLVSPKLAETLARETGAETLVLNPIEGLTDEEAAEGKDYFTAMQQNLLNLQTALQCTK